jgi:hypothetical protein
MFSAAAEQKILLFPLIKVNFNTWREKVGKDLAALIYLHNEWFLEWIFLVKIFNA